MSTTTLIKADPSQPDHASAIVHLLDIYASSPTGGGEGLPDFTKVNLCHELSKKPGTHVILAYADEQPAGLIISFEGFSTFQCKPILNIHDVIVHPDHRGKGLAKQLLEKCEEVAREIGCCKLTLEVLEGNDIAKRAYTSFGFTGYELDPAMGRAMFWEKKL
ncbi:MAG: GNAT family N-acetyltransferase [Akkermansiaceae bacterium]|jgi:ribosomal protein S18 acetylase RimI-like enzyme|nr:GNAT family N-acetyltransferase [Akkermansiaceae bacterium]MDP4646293.1 GNAT family N-acetyltransferase [Akkermansiaceae bacterium]MDP4721473.1 GNAT family N-acetyltransferase [Akkermansiaceae bacterium]MDP4779866.1 GNAT family N-acetyltransferase [Akkermansiaceae bacterium]MDP4845833.1 GNAT family N-acetyltransferase [Akkermansiaceae bacterium]